MSQILHLEGLFGSGKSTAAENLRDCFVSQGIGARWYLEEFHGELVRGFA